MITSKFKRQSLLVGSRIRSLRKDHFFNEGAAGATREREYEFLRQYQRLSPRAQEEVQAFIQFKMQTEEKVRDEKIKKDN